MRFNRNTMRSWIRFEVLRSCTWMKTSIRVQGERHWIWTFSTPSESFFVIRKSRGTKVLVEVLTRRFKGIIVCDGWKPYTRFTNRIQRCWHICFESQKTIAEKFKEAIPLHNAIKELYEILTEVLENDPPPKSERDYGNWREKHLMHLDPERVLYRESPKINQENQQRLRLLVHIYHQSRCRADQ